MNLQSKMIKLKFFFNHIVSVCVSNFNMKKKKKRNYGVHYIIIFSFIAYIIFYENIINCCTHTQKKPLEVRTLFKEQYLNVFCACWMIWGSLQSFNEVCLVFWARGLLVCNFKGEILTTSWERERTSLGPVLWCTGFVGI